MSVQVEVQPGVLLDVQQCVASKDASKLIPAGQLHTGPAASAACRGQPSSAADLSTEHQQQPLGKGESIKPYEQQTLQLNPELAALESDMRQQLRAKATVHRTEKTVLLGAFAQVGTLSLGCPGSALSNRSGHKQVCAGSMSLLQGINSSEPHGSSSYVCVLCVTSSGSLCCNFVLCVYGGRGSFSSDIGKCLS